MSLNYKVIIILIMHFNLSADLQSINTRPGYIGFDQYYRYADIQNYLRRLSDTYPNIVHIRNYGESVEKRNLTAIELSVKKFFKKPMIFIDAGIHAREWISTALALYIINQLLENPQYYYMIEKVDWLIIPLVNPDGYEHSHTVDRFWRKNRRKGTKCNGVDLNRNFNFEWLQAGASNDECSNFFAGKYAFSEPEARALSQIMMENAYRIKSYITLHAPAKLILYPWAYTTKVTSNFKELHQLAMEMSNAIYNQSNSTVYGHGTIGNVLYLGSGTSVDWAYNIANIKLCYAFELRGRDSTTFHLRFDLAKNDILSVVAEMFEAIIVMHAHVEHKFGGFLQNIRRLTLL